MSKYWPVLLIGALVTALALGARVIFLLTIADDHETHKVIEVIDGDTIFLDNGESVRYLGIDAPETHHPSRGLECFGPEATLRNDQLVGGKRVSLEMDTTDRDRYGRLLRYVYSEEVFINAVLVEEGYAYSSYYPPDIKHHDELLDLELNAETAGRGLWSACRP